MTWVRLDDQFHRNSKALKMSDAAHRIYVDTLSYCSDTKILTGFLSMPEAETFIRGRKKSMAVVTELVDLGAWEAGPDGYLIHDFEKYVPSRSQPAVIEWRSNKRAEWNSIGNQTAIKRQSKTDWMPMTSGLPVPVPEPVPVTGSKEPLSVGSPQNGIPETSMHVSGLHPISKILGDLKLQSMSRKETA